MSRPKPWAATAAVGFTLIAVSALMAFLADHHWYLGYETSLGLSVWFWWIQAAGIVSSVVGCIGLLVNVRPKAALLIGVALIAADLLLLFSFGWEVLNVHNWRFVLLLPVLLVFVNGAMFAIVGSFRLALRRRGSTQPV